MFISRVISITLITMTADVACLTLIKPVVRYVHFTRYSITRPVRPFNSTAIFSTISSTTPLSSPSQCNLSAHPYNHVGFSLQMGSWPASVRTISLRKNVPPDLHADPSWTPVPELINTHPELISSTDCICKY